MNKSTISVLLLGLLLLVGLFLFMKPAQQPAIATDLPAQVFEFSIENGQLVEGPALIAVTQGTPVTLRFASSAPDEIHLHGYDLTADLKPGEMTAMTFVAKVTGRFEIELHKSHSKLIVLEVRPR